MKYHSDLNTIYNYSASLDCLRDVNFKPSLTYANFLPFNTDTVTGNPGTTSK